MGSGCMDAPGAVRLKRYWGFSSVCPLYSSGRLLLLLGSGFNGAYRWPSTLTIQSVEQPFVS
jgi:hypothetical protein